MSKYRIKWNGAVLSILIGFGCGIIGMLMFTVDFPTGIIVEVDGHARRLSEREVLKYFEPIRDHHPAYNQSIMDVERVQDKRFLFGYGIISAGLVLTVLSCALFFSLAKDRPRCWFYALGDEQVGPVSEEHLARLLQRGQIDPQTMVQEAGLPNRMPVASIAGLQTDFYAGFWRRVRAFIIDALILVIVFFVCGWLVNTFFVPTIPMEAGTVADPVEASHPLAIGFYVLVPWLYFALFESSNSQATLGKMVVNIQVTDMEGKRVSFGMATRRYWGKLFSALILGGGFIMILLTTKEQALHDIITDCLVVENSGIALGKKG